MDGHGHAHIKRRNKNGVLCSIPAVLARTRYTYKLQKELCDFSNPICELEALMFTFKMDIA